MRQNFGALSATRASTELMETFLLKEHDATAPLRGAINAALNAWLIGNLASGEDGISELPSKETLLSERQKHASAQGIEAAILEREGNTAIRYRTLRDDEIAAAIAD